MNNLDSSESKVIKDMNDDYNSKVSRLLDEIDELKQEILVNKRIIYLLNERLHSLFIKLSGKMLPQEINRQFEFKRKISKIRIGRIARRMNDSGEIVDVFVMSNRLFPRYRDMLEMREIHLNKVLERLGLTAQEKKKKKKII